MKSNEEMLKATVSIGLSDEVKSIITELIRDAIEEAMAGANNQVSATAADSWELNDTPGDVPIEASAKAPVTEEKDTKVSEYSVDDVRAELN